MPESPFDFDPEKDKLPKPVMVWIIIASIGMAIYLSIILV